MNPLFPPDSFPRWSHLLLLLALLLLGRAARAHATPPPPEPEPGERPRPPKRPKWNICPRICNKNERAWGTSRQSFAAVFTNYFSAMLNATNVRALLLALLGLSATAARAQSVGIGATGFTPPASAALEIRASDRGLLIPRLSSRERGAISAPVQGLLVYQTDAPEGFYYYAGTGRAAAWVYLDPAAGGSGPADNLGNHTATQNLNLTTKLLVGGTAASPGTQGLAVSAGGQVGIGLSTAPTERLEVGGSVKLSGAAGTDGVVFPDGTRQTTAASGGALTLPYGGTANPPASGPVFQITNSGSGSGLRGASASGQGVVGRVNGTGAGQGVVGIKGTNIPNIEDAAVVGLSEADYGVYAHSKQQTGVVGITDGTDPAVAGVSGTAGAGVGVYGKSSGNSGVYGVSSANNVSVAGVQGVGYAGSGGVGVLGTATSGFGVRGVATAPYGYGVNGVAAGSNSNGIGGSGSGGATGVYGSASDNGRAGYFTQTSSTSTVPAVEISQAGTGPALKLDGKVNTATTGSANLLPVAYGRVTVIYDAVGNIVATKVVGISNWTVSRLGVGRYLITFTSPDLSAIPSDQLVIQLTSLSYGDSVINAAPATSSNGKISIYTNNLVDNV